MAGSLIEMTSMQDQADIFDPQFCRKWVNRFRDQWGPIPAAKRIWFQEGMISAEHGFPDERVSPGICGPLELLSGGNEIDLGELGRSYWLLPGYVKPDQLAFKRCSARGILVVKHWGTARQLAGIDFPKRARMLVLCVDGMPLLNSREFLHRLATELKLPVYLLTANDPWGYYTFSVLRRGAILSHVEPTGTRIREVRYLGIRAGDYKLIQHRNRDGCVIKGGAEVPVRLQCMRKYPCFKSAVWQKEFDRYEEQGGFVDLEAFTAASGWEWVADFVQSRIWKQDWIS
jgi:DNA topoisomerase VI subunit A